MTFERYVQHPSLGL